MSEPPADYWQYRHTAAHGDFLRSRDLLLDLRDDHEAASALFRWPRPEFFNWALEWFDVIARDNDRPALQLLQDGGAGETLSFAQLSAESDRTANWLLAAGVRRGDHVMVVLAQQRELWEVLLACLKIGAVVVPTYTSLTAAEAADRLRRGRIRHVICRDDLTHLITGPVSGLRAAVPGSTEGWSSYRDRLSHEPRFLPQAPTGADDVAFCYFTSGTTSAPKLVAHTHSSYPIGHLSSLYWNGLRPGDRHLNISAPGWAKHSWSSLFVPWNAEATIVATPPGPLDPGTLPGLLKDHGVTSVCAPASTWQAVRPHLGAARPALREATSAGEPLTEQIVEEVAAAWGVTLRDGYGQSEATAMIGTSPGLPRRPGRLGRVLPGYRIVLRAPDGSPGPGQGEICVDLEGGRPAGLMAGYLDESGTLKPASAEGIYRTGDLATCDAGGYFRILGRTDDVFKSFDHRISPYELEAVLKSHPAVAEAAVIPRPHRVGGFTPHAVVELVPGRHADDVSAEALLHHCSDRLAPELCPRSVEFTPRLPRTTSGKVRRSALSG
ncbi:AMP-binding protein [Streptomyces sp. NPDC048669]|uniref:AMP-binding protein n=1 Tax=Streptomyces sp. NPDC048669 TaxID=3155267 RepID=UPI0034396B77